MTLPRADRGFASLPSRRDRWCSDCRAFQPQGREVESSSGLPGGACETSSEMSSLQEFDATLFRLEAALLEGQCPPENTGDGMEI